MFLPITLFFLLTKLLSAQYGIDNKIHATIDPRVIMLVFNYDVSVVFPNTTYLNSALNVSLSTSSGTLPSYTWLAAFATSDNKVVQITLSIYSIPYATTVNVDFPTISPSRGIYLTSPRLSLPLQRYSPLTTDETTLLDAMNIAETISQYMWMAFATITLLVYPYSQIYLNIKLMMETADILRNANIGYNNLLINFWKRNNNQAAGLKFINFISIYAENNDFNMGYTRDESYISATARVSDFRFRSLQNLHRNYYFPLFFDAWGTNFFVILILLFILIVLEIVKEIVRRRHGNLKGFFTHKARIWIRWNLIISIFFGSSASIFYYCIAQFVNSANSDNTKNNQINLGFAISIFIIWFVALLSALNWLLEASSIKKENADYYQIMNHPYKKGKKIYNLNFIFLILKYVIFSVLVMPSDFSGIGQAVMLVIFQCFYIIYLFAVQPFKIKRCFLFQLFYEISFLLYLILILVVAKLDNDSDYTSSARDNACSILMYLWMIFPYLGSILGFIEVFIWPWIEAKPVELPKIEMMIKSFDKSVSGVHSRYTNAISLASENTTEGIPPGGLMSFSWAARSKFGQYFEKDDDHRKIQMALDAQLAKLGKKSNTAADPENASFAVSVDEIDILPYKLQYEKGVKPPKTTQTNQSELYLSQKAREVSKTVYINDKIATEFPEDQNKKSLEQKKSSIFGQSSKTHMPDISIKPFHVVNKVELTPVKSQNNTLDNSSLIMLRPYNSILPQEISPSPWGSNLDYGTSDKKFSIFERDNPPKFDPEASDGYFSEFKSKLDNWYDSEKKK